MSYETFSPSAPFYNGASLTTGIATTVPNNPIHPDADDSLFPTKYDQFVNKTNSNNNSLVNVTDESRISTELFVTTGGTYSGYLFLNHRPLNSTSINISNGTIVTGATDYTNGIVYFSSLPTGTFNLTYFGVPDAYWGDHVNAMQNAIMNIQRTIGAGSLSGEGFKNASFLLHDYPVSIQTILPNATHVEQLDRNLSIKGEAGSARTITLGNGADSIIVDAKDIVFKNTDVSYDFTGTFGESNRDKFFVPGLWAFTATGGTGAIIGSGYGTGAIVTIGNPFASSSTGVVAAPTGYALPSGSMPILRVFGDAQILGNVYVTGSITIVPTATGATISTITNTLAVGQDLMVTGNTTLGSTTNTSTLVNGTAVFGRSVHVKALGLDVSRIDGSLDVRNVGNTNNGLGGTYSDSVVSRGTTHLPDLPFHLSKDLRNSPTVHTDLSINKNTTFDGLDASYVAKLLKFRGFDRHDFKHNMVNEGRRQGITGSVTSISAPGTSVWFDTGLSFPTGLGVFNNTFPDNGYSGQGYKAVRWPHLGGNYYHGKFGNELFSITGGEFKGTIASESYHEYGDGNEWYVKWTQNDTNGFTNPGAWKYGARIPLKSITFQYNTGSPYMPTGNSTVTLSRAFNTAIQVGDTYELYHPAHSRPNAMIKTASTVLTVKASEIDPIIVNINGVHKVITVDCNHSVVSPYTGMNFVYIELDTPEIAKQQYVPGTILETEATTVVTQDYAESDTRVLLGEFYSAAPGSVRIFEPSIITYAYNGKYDTLWLRTQNTGNVYQSSFRSETAWRSDFATGSTVTGNIFNTGAIESGSSYLPYRDLSDILVDQSGSYKTRVHHNLGSLKRFKDANINVYVAPNLGNDYTGQIASGALLYGPDYGYVQLLEEVKYVPPGTTYPCYEIAHATRNYADFIFYNIAEVPGAIIGARTPTGSRTYALTGTYGNTGSYGGSDQIANRTRNFWWTRVVID